MATTNITISDLDDSPGALTRNFTTVEGVRYAIDLTDEQYQELVASGNAALASYVEVARRTGGPRRRTAGSTTTRRSNTTAIRKWARENGYEVSDRGRVNEKIKAAYAAAMAEQGGTEN